VEALSLLVRQQARALGRRGAELTGRAAENECLRLAAAVEGCLAAPTPANLARASEVVGQGLGGRVVWMALQVRGDRVGSLPEPPPPDLVRVSHESSPGVLGLVAVAGPVGPADQDVLQAVALRLGTAALRLAWQRERELQAASQEREHLVRTLAHEAGSPLATLDGNLAYLEGELASADAEVRDALADAREAAARVASVVRHLVRVLEHGAEVERIPATAILAALDRRRGARTAWNGGDVTVLTQQGDFMAALEDLGASLGGVALSAGVDGRGLVVSVPGTVDLPELAPCLAAAGLQVARHATSWDLLLPFRMTRTMPPR
jgi:signal transduction histidine kinase